MPRLARLALLTGLALILLLVLVTAGVVGLLASERGTRWMAGLAVDRLGVDLRTATFFADGTAQRNAFVRAAPLLGSADR